MTERGFDLATYRRERLRALEKRCDWLEVYRTRLEISLALALQCATAGSRCEPLDLLAVIEPVAVIEQEKRVADKRARALLSSLKESA